MAEDKKWVTINGAHVPIEDGRPQYGGKVARVRNIVDKRRNETEKRKARAAVVDKQPQKFSAKRKTVLTTVFFHIKKRGDIMLHDY